MAKPTMKLKEYTLEQLERLFDQIEKEKARRSKDVRAAKQKILSVMKEFGLSVADFAEAEMKKSATAKKKTRRKKAKRKGAEKAAPAAAKAAPAKSAKPARKTRKASTAKKTAKKKTRKKVAPKYANPEDKSMKWTGRGRQPLWVVTALKSGKTMDDLRI